MFSIVMPMDPNRLKQFTTTKELYDKMDQVKEFLIPTRNAEKIEEYLEEHGLSKDVRILPYTHAIGFNPSKAFNIATRAAHYNNIIITSPEVKPKTDVLAQLSEHLDENVLCRVWAQKENGDTSEVLIQNGYRSKSPAMYFLGMFKKEDIEAINGWDEDFMLGYAYEDNDFGERWNRAGLPFKIYDEIQAVHQFHPRSETLPGGQAINKIKYDDNNDKGVIKPKHGLMVL